MPKLRTVEEIRAGSVTPLNQPRPIQVKYSGRGEELQVTQVETAGGWVACEQVDRWYVTDRWWCEESEQVERRYFELRLSDHRSLVVFFDAIKKAWFTQRWLDRRENDGPAPYAPPVPDDGAVG